MVKNKIVGRPRQRQYQDCSCSRPARSACQAASTMGTTIQGEIQTARLVPDQDRREHRKRDECPGPGSRMQQYTPALRHAQEIEQHAESKQYGVIFAEPGKP